MAEAKFFQCELKEIKGDVFDHIYPHLKNNPKKPTLVERLPNGGTCPECWRKEWMLLPLEGAAVRTGGKPYIECLCCGYQTHL